MEVDDNSRPVLSPLAKGLGYFWLCNACYRTMTVVAENGESKIAQRAAGSVVPQTAA